MDAVQPTRGLAVLKYTFTTFRYLQYLTTWLQRSFSHLHLIYVSMSNFLLISSLSSSKDHMV